jgi:hypothetical protein
VTAEVIHRSGVDGTVRAQAVADRIDLYWLPLGAGGHSVRMNGRVFEALQAWREHRPRAALYHAALEVRSGGTRFVLEFAPVPRRSPDRGVVVTGPVGSRLLGRLRLFTYELRCWRDGVIPDVDEAVASPMRVSDDPAIVRRLLELAPSVPPYLWGRDELDTGEMWTSNSAISWLLARSGVAVKSVPLPSGGRAPGWDAGVIAARREQRQAHLRLARASVATCAFRGELVKR